MDYNKAALEMHETHKGKVGIVSKVEVATRDDLSTAYTPGVAEPCRKIKENPDDVYKRQKWEALAVHANFLVLPRALPLRKDFPRSGGRCRAATKGGICHRR